MIFEDLIYLIAKWIYQLYQFLGEPVCEAFRDLYQRLMWFVCRYLSSCCCRPIFASVRQEVLDQNRTWRPTLECEEPLPNQLWYPMKWKIESCTKLITKICHGLTLNASSTSIVSSTTLEIILVIFKVTLITCPIKIISVFTNSSLIGGFSLQLQLVLVPINTNKSSTENIIFVE